MTNLAETSAEQLVLPRGWAWTTLGDVAQIRLGKMLSRKAFEPGLNQRPYLRNENVRWFEIDTSDVKCMGFTPEEEEKFRLRLGDLLVCEGGQPGRCAVVTPAAVGYLYQKALHRVRPIEGAIDPRYLQYFFKRFIESVGVIERRSETTIQHLPREKMVRIRVPLPPFNEQARIADRIDELFSDLAHGVEVLTRVKRKLERYRAAVLHAAVTGRLSAAWRDRHGPPVEPAEALLNRILTARREHWEAQTLAKYIAKGKAPPRDWKSRYPEPAAPNRAANATALPEGWCWATATQLCAGVENGNTPPPEEMRAGSGEVPFIKVYNLTKRGDLDFTVKPTFVSQETHTQNLRRSIVRPRDVLMNIVGPPLGKVSLVPATYPEWNINQAIVAFHCLSGLDPEFLVICLLADTVLRPVTSRAKASAGQYNISVSMCREMCIPLAPVEEQAFLVAEVQRQLSLIDGLEAEIGHSLKRTGRLRQAILKAAFEGRLVPQDPTDEPASALLQRLAALSGEAQTKRSKTPRQSRPRRGAIHA